MTRVPQLGGQPDLRGGGQVGQQVLPGTLEGVGGYRRPSLCIPLTGLHYAIGCYRYQSCEHPGWEGSDVEQWTLRLREALARHPQVDTDSPFGNHPWGYEETDVHAAAASRPRKLIGR